MGAVSSGYEEGYCGYRFDSEWLGYTVRFRHYDPAAGYGRWLERDPAGYRAGGSLYAYLGHAPTDSTDSFGLDEYIQRAGGPLQDVPGGRGDDGLFLESHWNPIIERRAEEARNAKPYVEELGWNLILTPLLEATGAVEKALGLAARELGWTAGRAWGAGGASAGFIVRAGSAGLDWVFNTKTGRWLRQIFAPGKSVVVVVGRLQERVNGWAGLLRTRIPGADVRTIPGMMPWLLDRKMYRSAKLFNKLWIEWHKLLGHIVHDIGIPEGQGGGFYYGPIEEPAIRSYPLRIIVPPEIVDPLIGPLLGRPCSLRSAHEPYRLEPLRLATLQTSRTPQQPLPVRSRRVTLEGAAA